MRRIAPSPIVPLRYSAGVKRRDLKAGYQRLVSPAWTIARIALRRCSGSVGQASMTAARSGSAMASELGAISPVGGVWEAALALLRAALCAAVLAFDFAT